MTGTQKQRQRMAPGEYERTFTRCRAAYLDPDVRQADVIERFGKSLLAEVMASCTPEERERMRKARTQGPSTRNMRTGMGWRTQNQLAKAAKGKF